MPYVGSMSFWLARIVSATHMGGCQNDGPFWVLSIIRHLVFRGPKRGPRFDNHPYGGCQYDRPGLIWALGLMRARSSSMLRSIE